jgi:hypothetical protein
MADWARVVNTTIKEYVRTEEINVLRNRKTTALMRAKGRITFNHSGDGTDWKVQYKRAPLAGYADTDTLTFSRINRWLSAQLDWRGYAIPDSQTKMEKLKNKGTEAIIKIYDGVARRLMADIEDQFSDEFYIDGNAAGNSKRIHGIESFFSNASGTTPLVGQPIKQPNNSYANLLTNLANYGGAWTTIAGNSQWPVGTGDAHYDFWSPLMVDYTNANAISTAAGTNGWSATTKTWPNTCIEALRYGIIHSRKNKTAKGMLDFIMLNDEMFRQFEMAQDPKERIMVDSKEGLKAFGFEDIIRINGCDVTYEYGTPVATGYGWNIDQMELRSLQPQLFVPEGPDYDIASKSWRFSVDMFGNMIFNPRYFLKLFNYS